MGRTEPDEGPEAPDDPTPQEPAALVFRPTHSRTWRRDAARVRPLEVEAFYVMSLGSQSQVRAIEELTRGILNSSLIHPREVFRSAILAGAAGIIVVHNHPSGDPTPSGDDRAVTRQLVDAGRLLDLPVYDHVILGGDRYMSFAEAGLL